MSLCILCNTITITELIFCIIQDQEPIKGMYIYFFFECLLMLVPKRKSNNNNKINVCIQI